MTPQSGAERSAAYRARKKAGETWQPKPCGTWAAAQRHKRNNEPLCAACVEAVRERNAANYRRRMQ